jgi:ATP-dependent Clp protease protease subunit
MWKHDKLDEVQKGLLDQNIISIGGEIDVDTAMYVREAILRLVCKGSPPIKVLITSTGGSVRFGLDIYDALKYYAGEKTGVVSGIAHSMACVILQACQKRQCMRHSSVLIHHVSTTEMSLDAIRDKTEIAKIREDLEGDQARIYKILSKKTRKSVKKIRKECVKNKQMNSEKALKFGLIDEII